jgi:hypothetical protein
MKIKIFFIVFILFFAFIIIDVFTSDYKNKIITQKECEKYNKMEFNHEIVKMQIVTYRHGEKEVFIRNVINDSLIKVNPNDINTSKNIFDVAKVGDLLVKKKFGKFLVIVKNGNSDTLEYKKCNF